MITVWGTSVGLSTTLQRVLDLAGEYSKDQTPAMASRDDLLRDCVADLTVAVGDIAPIERLRFDLRVKAGGRQSNYSPVPWVRLYSPAHSPTATSGYYLVYLFAADGSRVYLSLNQGTSEFRSGAMRPITKLEVLTTRATEARAAIIDFAATLPATAGRLSIDLAWASMSTVGAESRQRVRNYEAGDIVAYEYVSGAVPDDEHLYSDLAAMLPLLAQLYRTPVIRPAAAIDEKNSPRESLAARATRNSVRRSQGRQLDPATRRAIEVYAEDCAIHELEQAGWKVGRVGHLHRGYDLECTRPDGAALHVEVKGTQTRGEEVTLTPGEVRHNQDQEKCPAAHGLYVVSEIQVQPGDPVVCSAGRPQFTTPWLIDAADLVPREYSYRVPRAEP
ncbi:MrcB family domain-containing protein [Micromonospora sp. WMMD730]|uniref:MrcB family domain-containing protein n=1 Tax=Micromonospora sp. WMMD730 TaxID=3404128 RepID=UPI003B9614DB